MLLPVKPITVKIPTTSSEVVKTITLKVRNADILPVKERAGHVVRLSVGPGTCPALIVDALPDFDRTTAGEQDSVLVTGGKTKTAKVRLRVQAADFTSHNGLAPDRCALRVEASTVQTDNQDPTPSNNVQMVELNVIDAHDSSMTTHESVLKSVNPAKLTIAENATSGTKTVRVKLTNADVGEVLGHAITLAVDTAQSDCPSASVSVLAPSMQTVAGGSTATASVGITMNRDLARSGNAKSPARCTAVLTATGPGVDPKPANNSVRLVVEVNDKNDY
jgi:hypothetical protein